MDLSFDEILRMLDDPDYEPEYRLQKSLPISGLIQEADTIYEGHLDPNSDEDPICHGIVVDTDGGVIELYDATNPYDPHKRYCWHDFVHMKKFTIVRDGLYRHCTATDTPKRGRRILIS